MAPLPTEKIAKGQVLTGTVQRLDRGEVVLDMGDDFQGVFRPRVTENFRRGERYACKVLSVDFYSRRVALDVPHGVLELEEEAPRSSSSCQSCEDSETGWKTAGVGCHPDGKPLNQFCVGQRVRGVVARIRSHRFYIDFGASREGMIQPPGDGRLMDFIKGETVPDLTISAINRKSGMVTLSMPALSARDVKAMVDRDWGPCLALYVHGSTIFSNKKPDDIDVLAVVDEPARKEIRSDTVDSQFKLGPYEVSVYTRSTWQRKMAEMDLTMITCLSLPKRFVLYEKDPSLRSASLDLLKLHESILSYAEFTWVKAHYMLEQKKDVLKASKNAYFVFRVLELGRQLFLYGRITDFYAANPWWQKVRSIFVDLAVKPGDWNIVEVTLGCDVQEQFRRFHDAFAAGVNWILPRHFPRQLLPLVVESLLAPPAIYGQCCKCAEVEERKVCGLCCKPLAAALCVTLPRCRHTFHRDCAVKQLRKTPRTLKTGQCWQCQRPVQLGLDKEVLASYLGPEVQDSRGRRRRFGGYPATVLLPEEREEAVDAASARALMHRMML